MVQSAADQAKNEVRDLFENSAVEAVSKEQLQSLLDGNRDKDTFLVLYAPWCQYSQVRLPPTPVASQHINNKDKVCEVQRWHVLCIGGFTSQSRLWHAHGHVLGSKCCNANTFVVGWHWRSRLAGA